MIERQLAARGITDRRVLAAMREIPRERFVPAELASLAYQDDPLPIGYGQTISQPYITAFMVQALALRGDEKVLEVGSGSGYHAAVLARLAAEVISIEIIPALASLARANLKRAGFANNVTVITGDGSIGYPPLAPYDCISVAAGAPETPPALLAQLKTPGRLVIPVGPMSDQELKLITKTRGKTTTRTLSPVRFVPLRGEKGWK